MNGIGQFNLPPWEDVEEAFAGIFERRYFANNGPLVRELDAALARALEIEYAVCVTNEMLGTAILAKALLAPGDVVVPAYAPRVLVEALIWAGLTPVPADVDPVTFLPSAKSVGPTVTERTVAIVGTHLFGFACDPMELRAAANAVDARLLFDAFDALGSKRGNTFVGCCGDGEVFSFHERTVVNAGEGGCITTRDESTAQKLRTIRNFHAGETFAPVALRTNGKMSEAQAALALLGLQNLDTIVAENRRRFEAYAEGLRGLGGIELWGSARSAASNCARVVVRVDAGRAGVTRDRLAKGLAAKKVPHAIPLALWPNDAANAFPLSAAFCASLLELPNGSATTLDDVATICGIVRQL